MTEDEISDFRADELRSSLQRVLQHVEAEPLALAKLLAAEQRPFVAFGADRQILCANAAAESIFGHGRGQLDGHSTDMLIPERLRQPNAPPMVPTPDLMQVDLPGLVGDGSERLIEWCFGSVHGQEPAVFVMTVRDRAEVDRTIEALRASEERFRLLVNSVRDCAIFTLDADGRVASWNEGAALIKGWRTEEILKQPYEVFFTPEDRALGVPAKILGIAAAAGSHEVEGWRVRKDGSRFWAQGSVTALRNAAGELRGFAKVTRDLTARLQAEENQRHLIAERAAREAAQEGERLLRTSEDRLSRLQRASAALSVAVTPEDVSNVVLSEVVNAMGAAACGVYLLSSDRKRLELVAQCGYEEEFLAGFTSLPSDAPLPLSDAVRRRDAVFFESADAFWEQYPALRESLAEGPFRSGAALPLVAHGTLLGVLAISFERQRTFDSSERAHLLTLSDICGQALDRALLFAAEREARANAESASRSKDEFLAMLSHELRNPLAPISTAVQLMKLRDNTGTAREREVIERQIHHLSKLVDDLLDVSRVARGLITLSRSELEVSDALSKAVEMASPLLEQRRQQLSVSAPEAGLLLHADPLRIAQVVANLLTNASKYTPPGGRVWLSAVLEGDEAVIRVRDDGEGIGAELLPHVFDLFVQGTRTIARSEGGLGLGLALVKSLVTLHGGTVSATSEGLNRGSEFTIRLPAFASSAPPLLNKAAQASNLPLARKRILLVDDNEDATEMLASFLSDLGHQVETALDGPVALEKLRDFPVDVAILDLGLPVMDGFELARRIQQDHGDRRPRLIAVTGYGRERDLAQSRAAGFDVHLVKPVDLDLLIAAMDAPSAESQDERASLDQTERSQSSARSSALENTAD